MSKEGARETETAREEAIGLEVLMKCKEFLDEEGDASKEEGKEKKRVMTVR